MSELPLTRPRQRHSAILSRLKSYGRRPHEADINRAGLRIARVLLFYFVVGTGINLIGPYYLMSAWLSAGALGTAVYFARRSRRPALNVFTVLFAMCAVGCLAGFALSRGWYL